MPAGEYSVESLAVPSAVAIRSEDRHTQTIALTNAVEANSVP